MPTRKPYVSVTYTTANLILKKEAPSPINWKDNAGQKCRYDDILYDGLIQSLGSPKVEETY